MNLPPWEGELECLLVCDAIANSSGKNSLIGVFNRIWASQFPCIYPHMSVYLRMRLTTGSYQFEIQIIDSDQHIIFRTNPPMEAVVGVDDVTREFSIHLSQIAFPNPGEYWFQCLVNGRVVESIFYRLVLVETEAKSVSFEG
ncbi:MAG: hypothetical protein SGI71_11995 [Verrucomicrobiota bacterium]|nr:hypothetical protein [Verrucomicrobiota bacterium]